MSLRLISILIAFLIVVGGPSVWLYISIIRRKRLLYGLLNLPKEKRFFWYKLRKDGFKVISHNSIREYEVSINSNSKRLSLKADFIVKKNSKKYVGIFAPVFDEKEYLKLLFAYSFVFNSNGVIFYNGREKDFTVWDITG